MLQVASLGGQLLQKKEAGNGVWGTTLETTTRVLPERVKEGCTAVGWKQLLAMVDQSGQLDWVAKARGWANDTVLEDSCHAMLGAHQ